MVKKHYKVLWNDEAKVSLHRVYNYIKKQESAEQANKVRKEIRELASSFGFMPHKYTRDPFLEEDHRDIRYKVIWSYRLVYEVTRETVIILDVIHTSRNPLSLRLVK
ncbi:MAG: hypothetical protein DRJ13_10840 [Bacteroidetes bacterium]|nr:MAG: hypothetical protein DRJ13_10840 [Bacteroidota bacterium]